MTVNDLTSVVNQLLPEPQAGLLNGLLFGTRIDLDPEFYQALIRTGTLHIVALSGMNITILTDLVNLALLWVISRRLSSLLTIGIIVWFISFVGVSPSIVRAAIMGGISLLAVIFGRQFWALLAWFLAVSIMLLLNFSWISDLSFQLSALATLGIILFGGQRAAAPSKVGFPRAILGLAKDNLRLTLSAQVLTIPLILFHFHRVSLISPLPNLLIGWILQPVTALGWATVAAGSFWLPLGQVVAWSAWVPLTYLLKVVEITARLPLASLSW